MALGIKISSASTTLVSSMASTTTLASLILVAGSLFDCLAANLWSLHPLLVAYLLLIPMFDVKLADDQFPQYIDLSAAFVASCKSALKTLSVTVLSTN